MTRLQQLRQAVSDALMPKVKAEQARRIELGWACVKCGGDIDEFSHGCKACSDRSRRIIKNVSKSGDGRTSPYGNQHLRDRAIAYHMEALARRGLLINGEHCGGDGNWGHKKVG